MEARTVTVTSGVDYERLAALRTTEHTRLGIRETFLTPDVGGSPTVAVLAEPLDGPVADLGWVVCHSQGHEQRFVEPLDVDLARGLAARGFRVLRFYCQGYGDSALVGVETSLSTHLRDTADAAAVLRDLGATELGFTGSRFGAIVASLAAEEHDARGLVLWDPVVTGKSYVRHLLRQDAISLMTQRALLEGWSYGEWDGRPTGGAPSADEQLARDGEISVDGLTISRRGYEELVAVDLASDLRRFAGDALVVQVSRNTSPRADILRLVDHLGTLEGTVRFETVAPVQGESAIGSARYLARGDDMDGRIKRDLQASLARTLVAQAGDWSEGLRT
jgi:pimeloyl-ACP methyl ester carboxylesterase